MATIKDVAREASVSIATVSRVFNGADVVRPETAQRIRDAAAALSADHESILQALRTRDAPLAKERARQHVLHAAALRQAASADDGAPKA